MEKYCHMSKDQLEKQKSLLLNEYENIKGKNLKLDMSRGKPSEKQLDLSMPMLMDMTKTEDLISENGTHVGNYGELYGIKEARKLMADLLDLEYDNILVGGNSSLNLMHDCISFAHIHGFPESEKPWGKYDNIKFLCPSPGYDRHFLISNHFGYELVEIEMQDSGPNMDQVDEYIKDPLVKGMWCVPKYSNPTGITYSDETIKQIATLNPAAKDFRVFLDNAYSVHDFHTDYGDNLLDISHELKKVNNENLVMMFTSTSKITFPGSGISAIGASKENLAWYASHVSLQTISYDKINQMRHVRFLKDKNTIKKHMAMHANIIKPKFDIVMDEFSKLSELGIAKWDKPNGGYFISLDVLDNCAKKVVKLCKDAGVILTPAGATHPYGIDKHDRTIRIAPTYPPEEELIQATHLLSVAIRLVSVNKFLQN